MVNTKPTKFPVPRFEIVRGKGKAAKEFLWRFIARNGKETARASETYKRRAGVIRSMATISRGARIIDTTKPADETKQSIFRGYEIGIKARRR